jgi:hypothetical protein
MLAGEAVIAIWNGIAPEGHAAFYDWHMREHIPERVGIPGICRGRRYAALRADTHPEFFTLYEAETFQVLQGTDYTARLNAPTPWTRAATSHFRNTARALARVIASDGPGMGGALATIRFEAEPAQAARLVALIRDIARQPRICGAHLCLTDTAASAVRTAETRNRTDIESPPAWFIMVEGTDAEALDEAAPPDRLAAAGGARPLERGFYRLEYARTKTAFSG